MFVRAITLVLIEFAGEVTCLPDVAPLGSLGASSQQDSECSALDIVHPVTRSVRNAKLGDALSDRPHIPGIVLLESLNPVKDTRPGLFVPKPPEPTGEGVGFANVGH